MKVREVNTRANSCGSGKLGSLFEFSKSQSDQNSLKVSKDVNGRLVKENTAR